MATQTTPETTPETSGAADGAFALEALLPVAIGAVIGILVLWIGLGYLWNNKYRPRQLKREIPTATFNNILGRILRFLFKEDKEQSKKLQAKNPTLAKFAVWRNFYLISIIAIVLMTIVTLTGVAQANPAPIIGLLVVVAAMRTRKVFYTRHKILVRMFEVAAAELGYPRQYASNPWAYVNIKKWEGMVVPGDTIVRFPAKFKSGEMRNRESFENHFSSTVTDGNSWLFEWKHAESYVQLSPVKHIPERAEYKGSEHSDWDKIPLGLGTNGEVVWEVSKNPHALVTGSTGAGKSVLQRNLIFHCIQHPDRWRFLGIDVKMVELTPYLKYEPVVLGVATNVEDGVEIVRYANEEMNNRYKMMTESGVNNFRDLANPPHALMVMIDESYAFLATTGNKTDEGKAKDALKGEASAAIGDIARLGRAAGVHLVMATQRPDAVVIYGELKQNLSARIAAGRADTIASQMTLDNDNATRLPAIKGRGYFQKDGVGEQFQGYFAEQSWIDNWLQRKENGGDVIQSEVVEEETKENKKGKLGKFKGLKKKPKEETPEEVSDVEALGLDDEEFDFVDPFANIPDDGPSNKELASLVNEFVSLEEEEYDNAFVNKDSTEDEAKISPKVVAPAVVASPIENLDSIFDQDDYELPFNPPVEEKKAKVKVASTVIDVADDDDPFADDFMFPLEPEEKIVAPVAKVKPRVEPTLAPTPVVAKETVSAMPVRKTPSAPTRPSMPSRPSAPKRPGS